MKLFRRQLPPFNILVRYRYRLGSCITSNLTEPIAEDLTGPFDLELA